jgi:uncharacterized membrane protein
MVTAMLPYLELRGSIPLAFALGAHPLEALLLSILGNLLPIVPLMFLLPFMAKLAERVSWINRFFCWVTTKVGRKKHNINRYGPIGLAIFVAIPLPMTGAWSGAVLAFLLGIPKRYAFPAITLGTIIAGIIVTILSVGVSMVFDV